nr:hypothetical protein [Methanobrevibacter arboriphilus]
MKIESIIVIFPSSCAMIPPAYNPLFSINLELVIFKFPFDCAITPPPNPVLLKKSLSIISIFPPSLYIAPPNPTV